MSLTPVVVVAELRLKQDAVVGFHGAYTAVQIVVDGEWQARYHSRDRPKDRRAGNSRR